MLMLDVYRRIMQEHLALPVIYGEKSENERFPGAENTFSCEAMMSDKKALQAGTSHFLGQNFARAFDISFQGRNGEMDFAWTTSWGVSTRLIGAIIMTHSDNDGLVLPPKVAPVKAVIIPISSDDGILANELEPAAAKITGELNASFGGLGAETDKKYHLRPGDRFFHHIQRGVPIRIELGEREYASGSVTITRRDTGEKERLPFEAVTARTGELLAEIQDNLYKRAKAFREENTFDVSSLAELEAFFKDSAKSGFARAFFAGSEDDEKEIKDLTGGATIRCMPLDEKTGKCVVTGQDGARAAIFAKSY
jgi:prolyl-tRNA synthetase